VVYRAIDGRGTARACFSLGLLVCVGCQGQEPPPRVDPPPPPPPPASGRAPCDLETEPHARLELPVWDLIVDDEAWDTLHEDVLADVEVDAEVCIDGERYPIELELQGSSTRRLDKKSFDLKFNRGKRLTGAPFDDGGDEDGLRKLFMKAMFADHSLIREALAFELLREMGGDAPRTGFANLRINGAYWGLYALVEPIEEDYLRRHGYPQGGNLYKAVRKHGEWADLAPGRDLTLAFESRRDDDLHGGRGDGGSDMEHEAPIEGESDDDGDDEGHGPEHEQADDHDAAAMPEAPWRVDLEHLVHVLQNTPLTVEAFAAEIDPIFPLSEYFERLIWVAWTQNSDATAQNYYLYNAPRDGRDFWYQLPWDSNLCFSADWKDGDAVRPPHEALLLDGRNHFGRRLLKVPELRERYIARFRHVLDSVLTPEIVFDRFEHLSRLVEDDLAVDQMRWQRNVDPASAFDVLVDFFEARPAALHVGLDDLQADVQ
jgi:hypothetical protein